MYELTIENPSAEALVKELYDDENIVNDPAFV